MTAISELGPRIAGTVVVGLTLLALFAIVMSELLRLMGVPRSATWAVVLLVLAIVATERCINSGLNTWLPAWPLVAVLYALSGVLFSLALVSARRSISARADDTPLGRGSTRHP